MLTLLFGETEKAHLPYVFESWRANAALFDFYVATSSERLSASFTATNVRFVVRSRAQFDAAILQTLGLGSSGKGVGPHWKPSTFSPALASFFEELGVTLDTYSHWGYLDSDVILGNLTHFFGPHMRPHVHTAPRRDRYDILSVYGYVDDRHLKVDRWGAINSRHRRLNPFGPTLFRNTDWSQNFWREVEAKEMNRSETGGERCVAGLLPATVHMDQGEYDVACGPRVPQRSITYTLFSGPDPPLDSWWDDFTFNTHIADRAGLNIFEACCALFDLTGTDGHAGSDGCSKVYSRGEVMRVCGRGDAFADRVAQESGCVSAIPTGGTKICQPFAEFTGRGDLKRTIKKDMHKTGVLEARIASTRLKTVCSSAYYHEENGRREPACFEFGFHRASPDPSEIHLVEDHESSRRIRQMTSSGQAFALREPAYHCWVDHLRKAEEVEALRRLRPRVYAEVPSAFDLEDLSTWMPPIPPILEGVAAAAGRPPSEDLILERDQFLQDPAVVRARERLVHDGRPA